MDGGAGYIGEIPAAGRSLRDMLRRALCPGYLRDAEGVMLASPWEQADFRVGVYLYDIQDYSAMMPGAVMLGESERQFPPKALELSYLVYCNENAGFGGGRSERAQEVLSGAVRAVYDCPVLTGEDGETVQLSFAMEDMEFKIKLWGSFNKPLQPALYVRAAPVLIASGRKDGFTKVEERDYRVGRKKTREETG